ncbi:FAD-dependent oxidoreductase [Halochromatium roseum]|uniref:FAD-dependent oxidoreductase n=1 Tax=Halochromatium roseum TaxID=391920 RepID=UPI00191179B2|nr:FAD-dependent oxidoreductase [Halochromatium roseum]MBK5937838.1 FAD-dependent oxidoreductase [Halochromatium roseum]
MHRRHFIRNVGLITVTGAALGGAGLYAIQPRRSTLPFASDQNATLPLSPSTKKRVVVVGGGLAGIAASYELAKRGFDVTLVERSSNLGGRLTGWDVDVNGETMATEHGFHGFFNQYYNLNGLLAENGLRDNFKPVLDYPVIFKDPAKGTESFTNTTTLFPFNLFAVVNQAKSVSLLDFNNPTGRLYEVMRYDPDKTFARLDDLDFKTFCERVNKPMVDTIIEPFAHTSFNQFHQYSTAEGIKFFHFFFLGNPDGMGYDQTIDDAMTSVITPLTNALTELGVRVTTGAEVDRLVAQDGRISKVILKRPGAILGAEHSIDAAAIGSDWTPFWNGSNLYYAKRDAQGEIHGVSGRCTHMGCPVGLDAATGGFACPCHGAKYDSNGVPTAGPTIVPLVELDATPTPEGQIKLSARPEQSNIELETDYVVLACDVPGVKAIIAQSELPSPELVSSVERLGVADPYIVWRLWLDRECPPMAVPFYTVSGWRYTDSIAIYSQMQPESEDWARRHQGSIIELHAYAVEPENVIDEAEIKRIMRAELDELIPELKGAKVVYDIYTMQENFPRWAPGDYAGRPGVRTPIDNLFLAGDYLRLEVPANLMEAATMTGRIAANQVLVAEGLRENPIPTVDPKGPLAL